AAKQQKPNGLTVIKPELAGKALADVAVTELAGINKGIGRFLAQYGVFHCADMKKIPISVLAQRFGNPGRRIWLMAQGQDPEPVNGYVAPPKTLGHGKVIPPNTQKPEVILLYLMHMAEKIAARLRRHQLQAQTFSIAIKTSDGWLHTRSKTINGTDDGTQIFQLCKFFFQQKWDNNGVFQVHIAALDPQAANEQQDLFITNNPLRQKLCQTIDNINHRYGEFTLCNAPLINRSSMPNVIAPAWKPDGHRDTLDH
ncbi:MAG: DNA polymerase IV, partial [Gammaproteobacteria bacterium]|nr:DNA polymerase IV [Gammaproteobacteria bacterium]